MSDPAASVSRPMKFPYTFAAKVAQFPYAFHVKNNWLYRYYCYGIIVSFPVFYKIHKLSNNPQNLANYAEMRRKEAAAHH